MRAAELGWASAGEDENVNELERRGAELLGKEAAVFVPTCTMANLAALLAHGHAGPVGRGRGVGARHDERVRRHLGARRPRARSPWTARRDGSSRATWIARSGARARRCSVSRTRTRAPGGTVADVERTEALAGAARRHGARVHLDGARLPNAAVALGVPLAALAAPVDTVALSLNKGLVRTVRRAARGRCGDDRGRARPRASARRRDDAQGRHRRGGRARRARTRRPAGRRPPTRALPRLAARPGRGAETNIVLTSSRRDALPELVAAACSRSRRTDVACASSPIAASATPTSAPVSSAKRRPEIARPSPSPGAPSTNGSSESGRRRPRAVPRPRSRGPSAGGRRARRAPARGVPPPGRPDAGR